ncbi:hypothetical protein A1O3_05541 [Capronia epimyces CBS 606.96]|uniref:Aminotransferase n=1 Tax=Capronia epimyces CBS 606.96 TaxID=1182542 RepID=W9Y6N3_9EURO|nr:uncharacterized protein A1O3_05541 [Capronia epimyces CBS 606.96]EXJ84866.1 hypothetical protein A1O3_05541 [Capronia epimyces CBS 606.96]
MDKTPIAINGTNGHVEQSSVLYRQLRQPPPKVVRSKGHYLYTDDGLEIFDASGGAAVCAIGHGHDRVKKAIAAQLDEIEYVYSLFFTTSAAERLSTLLTESTGGQMSRVFIVSSGTEAVEAALKMARQYFTELPQPQKQRTRFIARKQSYHGNTLGSLAVGSHPARRALYEPMLSANVSHVSPCYPYRESNGEDDETYVARLAQELEDEFQRVGPDTVCAFIAETMSGATLGCVPPVPGYLKAMKAVCERHGALFILDEVMAGMGRTGTLHAWEQEGVVPDLQTIAKGLGAGYTSIGALLVNQRVVAVLNQGTGAFMHSQTYQGNPLACAAAYEVQRTIQDENLLANVREMGKYLGELLKKRLSDHPHIGDIRGRGLFWAMELVKNKETKEPFGAKEQLAWNMHLAGLEHGICMIPGNGTVDGVVGDHIIVAPAYNITAQDIDLIVERTEKALRSRLG